LLSHADAATRAAAATTIGKIEPNSESSVPVLIGTLDDGDWNVRRAACLALGEIGKPAKAAVSRLFTLMDSEEDRDAARGALRQIDTAGADAVPLLVKALESDENRNRFFAIYLLGQAGPDAKEALPALQKLADSGSAGRFRRTIEDAIRKIEGREEEAEEDDND
jgi:HEAT repeat protein